MREQKECNTKKRIETLFILIVLNAFACTSQLHIAEPYTQCRCVLYVCVLFYRLSKRRDGKEWPINVGINNNLGISHFNWNDLQMKVSFQFHLKTCAHLLLSGFLFALVLIRLGLIVHQKVFPIRIWSDSVFYSSLIISFWCFVDSKERILLFWLIPSMFKDKILHIRKLDLLIKMSRTTFSEMKLIWRVKSTCPALGLPLIALNYWNSTLFISIIFCFRALNLFLFFIKSNCKSKSLRNVFGK